MAHQVLLQRHATPHRVSCGPGTGPAEPPERCPPHTEASGLRAGSGYRMAPTQELRFKCQSWGMRPLAGVLVCSPCCDLDSISL